MASNKLIIPVLLIIALSLISYLNIFKNEFVWDDHVFILENADIRSFSNLPLFFTNDVDGLYRPLRSFYYTFIYSMGGKNEFWYHLNSLFFHTITSILVFFIIYGITGRNSISLIASMIFAAHPMHTERVTNITGSFDMLGIFFMLLSFYLYIKFSKLGNKKHFFFSLLFLLIAVFSSEEAITLPLLIILYDFCSKREKFIEKIKIKKINENIIKNYAPYFIIALFYIAARIIVVGFRGRVEEYLAGNFFLTMLTMLKAYVYYIYLLIAPINLTLFRDIQPATSLFDLKVLISALILVSIIAFAVKNHKNGVLFFSVFWFFITLIPFSNILPLQVFMAERYLYVPSIAFSFLVSYSLIEIFNHNFNNLKIKNIVKYSVIMIIVLLLLFYVFSTISRNSYWKYNMTLWSKTIETNPSNSRAHDNLGFTYERAGETEKALQEFEIAVRLQPDNFRALANLGVAYAKFGFYNKSIIALEKSIEIRKYPKTYDKLGLVYDELNMEDKAI
ncbi:MAG: tetratricopeptide repeat protein, partial [Nanoarchaeota archaeon]